jgi:DNA-binding transcriptional regulator YiaG
MTPKPIDFGKVEALRKHMLLRTSDMAQLLGVSRVTYYGWVRGQAPRPGNEATVRAMLKQLLAIMTEHGWPMPDIIAASPKTRNDRLVALLKK